MSSSTTNLAISGLASGFDWQTLITQLIQVERAPESRMRTEQATLQGKNNAYGSIVTQLGTLQNAITTLKDPSLFDSRVTSVSDATIASATVADATAQGSYSFNISQMATTAAQVGTIDSGKALSATSNVDGVVLGTAGIATAISAGSFTVNGKSITIATTDTLQSVFDQISSVTGGAVTGGYDAATDKISLSGSGPIVLGSATDTSNFLSATKLYNNGGSAITSASSLGGIHLGGTLSTSNISTPITDGGAGAGAFTVNGVQISYNASSDSINDVLNKINNSTAGVTASYDSVNDRFQLTNKATGDIGISLHDDTGNFLAATGITGGSLQRGNNLQYTINNGGMITSTSNTITADSSGLTGLTISAIKTGTVSVTVGSNTAKIQSAITNFVNNYNSAQKFLDLQTASSTDATGKVTAGTLTGDTDATGLEDTLRKMVNATNSSLSGVIKNLDALGIVSNGNDNTLAISDTTKMTAALTNNLSSVKDMFTNSTSGLAITMGKYLDSVIGDNGTLISHQTALTKQSNDIDTNIANMERTILDDQDRLTNSFVAMETAQAQITQQQQYLTKTFQ